MSTSTGRWSKLNAYHEVRYIGDGISLIITISETSEGSQGVVWIGGFRCPDQRSDSSSRRHNHVIFPLSCAQPQLPFHVFGVEVAGHQFRLSPAERGGHISFDQWAGRRKVSLKDYQRFADQYDLNGSSIQVAQILNWHWVGHYTTADEDVRATPAVSLSVRWQT